MLLAEQPTTELSAAGEAAEIDALDAVIVEPVVGYALVWLGHVAPLLQ
jgi:hypothetical protein